MQIKNLNKAAKRLLRAVKSKEKIIFYGDADPDGICSVIILKETLQNLKLGSRGRSDLPRDHLVYLPDRETEGYGLNEKALRFLKNEAPALLLLLDCGIGNFKEIQKAEKQGFEVIVIDHHEILGKVPKASIVVDPKQKGDEYPFKDLATVGIAYKLSEALLKDGFSPRLKESFLELVALATLADMMPKEGDNRIFIEQGLQSLEKTFRPGLRAFFNIGAMKPDFNAYQIASKIISALNAGRAKDHLNETYLLLTAADEKEAERLAEKLIQKSYEKKEQVEAMKEEVEEKLAAKGNPVVSPSSVLPLMDSGQVIIFEGGSHWPIALLGSVASKICHSQRKPTFIFSQKEKESVGAVRMPKSLNAVKAMAACSQYLKTYGGHPPAAGFTVLNENLEKFKECLMKYFENL